MPRSKPKPKMTFEQRARVAANARWAGHAPQSVRLDSLTPEQRRLVKALVDAAKSETQKTAPAGINAEAVVEVRRASDTVS